MAKELPYFQFEPAEYLTKDISFCSLSAQGLFVNLCSYYWQRNCNLTKDQFLRRLNHSEVLEELITEGVIKINGSNITIDFLDKQRVKAVGLSKTNSKNGSKGGRPKKQKETEIKPTLNQIESESKGIRKEEIIKEEIREDKSKIPTEQVFVDYAKSKISNINVPTVRMKYHSWVDNDWCDGNDNKIKNWKTKLCNTLPYLKKDIVPSPI
jgi:hypothetical protein